LPAEPSADEGRDVVTVRRHLRKLARSRSYVKKVTVDRWSVDELTGEVTLRRRKVNRRQQYLKGQRAGFLVVNDGPAAARDIARLLGAAVTRDQYELVA
jgi:nitrate reductase beta subunit